MGINNLPTGPLLPNADSPAWRPTPKVDRFGDTIRSAVRAPIDSMNYWATQAANGDAGALQRLKAAGLAGLSGIDTLYSGAAGVAGEMFGGDPTQEKQLARDLMMMGHVAMPELAGGVVPSIAAGQAGARAAGRFAGDESGAFAGIGAKTADLNALNTAKQMSARGASRDEVWSSTGWFEGADGKWRFEIDDSQARFAPPPSGLKSGGMSDVMEHDALYAAYPDLAGIDTRAEVSKVYNNVGGYTPFENREHLGLFDLQEDIFARGPTDAGVRNTLLHEAQHAIQHREGFATGGNQSIARDLSAEPLAGEIQALQEYINNTRRAVSSSGDVGPFEQSMLESVADAERELSALQARVAGKPATAFDAYKRLGGEVESRNVEARSLWDAVARRASPPWVTQDFPDTDLINIIDRLPGS